MFSLRMKKRYLRIIFNTPSYLELWAPRKCFSLSSSFISIKQVVTFHMKNNMILWQNKNNHSLEGILGMQDSASLDAKKSVRTLIIPFQGFPRTLNFSSCTSVKSSKMSVSGFSHALVIPLINLQRVPIINK